MKRKFPHTKLMNKSWMHMGNHLRSRKCIVYLNCRQPLYGSRSFPEPSVNFLYLSLHEKSPLFLFPPTHQVSLYANEGRTTSCPFLLATDRLLSPNRSTICFLYKWVVDLQGSMKSEDNMTAVIVVFVSGSHMSHTLSCAAASLQNTQSTRWPVPSPTHRPPH